MRAFIFFRTLLLLSVTCICSGLSPALRA